MNLPKASLLLIGVLLCISDVAWGEANRLIPSYQSIPPVFRVYSSGKFDRVFPPSNEKPIVKPDGIEEVLISPTQQKIAFCKNNDLWVYDVSNNVSAQLTHIGKSATKQFDSVDVLLVRWSDDESKILFRVLRGFTDSPKERPAQYGLLFYDLKTSKVGRALPNTIKDESFLAWLVNGNLLLKDGHNIGQYDIAAGRNSTIFTTSGGYEIGQEDLTRDEQWITFTQVDNSQQTSQLFRLNLQTGKSSAITDKGNFAEYQSPIFSPSGKKIIYEHESNAKPNYSGPPTTPKSDLVIDGKNVYSFEGYRKIYWIDESTLVLINESVLTVIDIDAGIVKSNTKLR